MATVYIRFANSAPRINFNMQLKLDTIPVVGDVIFVQKEFFYNISKERLSQIYKGLKFKVVERLLVPQEVIYDSETLVWKLRVEFYDDHIYTYEEKRERKKSDKFFNK